jgi:AcrR family transcriptional regulator
MTLDQPTLADDKRQATVERILRAARRLIGERGLGVTVNDVAEAAGVGRRTVFRHFATREALLAAAVVAGMHRYGEQLPEFAGGDWRTWLRDLCIAAHRMNASYGPGYWELTTRRDLPAELEEVERNRRRARRTAMTRLSATLWAGAGGAGRPPADVTTAVAAHLSPHFTAAVVSDARGDWEDAAALATAAIEAAVASHLVRSHRRG